ncbi:MAG TPA: DUF378 domain-containing protein [Candidatus Paceibacterota bacterium]|nr:DUF378 domain-containing protein [Candidatus Paceibacterota bacterium]HQI25897.1 DUF378 domain-containing protein [Candidatus Paceibacterota bacterium]HQJ84052.1 DUF378 domain-containing protein [Candidatus Paceibacterota bacterium]
MGKFKALDWLAIILTIIGGINWGLVGLFGFDLVASLFGMMTVLSRVIYVVVGLAALYMVALAPKFAGRLSEME